MSRQNDRQPHAALNLKTRQYKAEKIAQLLGLGATDKGLSILEIGTGSGGIAHYLATMNKHHRVYSVDTVDNRQVTDNFHFQLVDGTELPFDDSHFDIVISNHVIEHVGLYDAQQSHMNEINRVLKQGGIGYLAVPNRWMLVEPHYRLIFLSYLPRKLRTPYLRWMRRGEYYDCEPLTRKETENILLQSGFTFSNICPQALKLTFAIEKPASLATAIISHVPDAIIGIFSGIIPTLIYRFQKNTPTIKSPLN